MINYHVMVITYDHHHHHHHHWSSSKIFRKLRWVGDSLCPFADQWICLQFANPWTLFCHFCHSSSCRNWKLCFSKDFYLRVIRDDLGEDETTWSGECGRVIRIVYMSKKSCVSNLIYRDKHWRHYHPVTFAFSCLFARKTIAKGIIITWPA